MAARTVGSTVGFEARRAAATCAAAVLLETLAFATGTAFLCETREYGARPTMRAK